MGFCSAASIYDMGINSKLWRLVRAWYTAPKCQVQLNGILSDQFSLQRGGSVLSPILFLIVMDPLLKGMESMDLGPSFAGLYLGASAHADDIRTVTSSLQCLRQQVDFVQSFATQNGFKLNIQKCEVMVAASTCNAGQVVCLIGPDELIARSSVKSLGFWWSWDLSARAAVEKAIQKSRRAFLCTNHKCFKGNLILCQEEPYLRPVSLLFCCMAVKIGCLQPHLEQFQEEIGRRILKLSANHSTLSCRIALRWPSVAARILIRKLCYVLRLRLLDNIASVLFQTSNPLHLSIIRECHFLEDHLSLHGYTDKVLNGEYDGSKKYLRDSILDLNDEWKLIIGSAKQRKSTEFVAHIASELSWLHLWDTI